jgi:ABC-type nitrate/sulfonate/bicarbonate transport system substrate-binding protein
MLPWQRSTVLAGQHPGGHAMFRALPIFISLLGLIAAGPLPAAAQTVAKQQVTVAMLAPSALMWVHAVAEKEGFYAERGISVRVLRASDSPALLQAVSTGSTDAGLSLGDLAIRAIDRGAPIVVVGAALDKAILRLYAPKGMQDLKDLNGHDVTAGAVRGGTADLLKYLVLRGGGEPASLKMVSIANSKDRIVALENGQLQGALLIAPFDTLAERAGFHVLAVYREPYVETPLILNKDWAAKHRPTAIALVQAMKKAASWMNAPENRAATIDILAAYTHAPRDVCEASYDFIIRDQHAIPANFAVTAPGLENIEKISAAVNGASAGTVPFELGKYYDPSFVEAK